MSGGDGGPNPLEGFPYANTLLHACRANGGQLGTLGILEASLTQTAIQRQPGAVRFTEPTERRPRPGPAEWSGYVQALLAPGGPPRAVGRGLQLLTSSQKDSKAFGALSQAASMEVVESNLAGLQMLHNPGLHLLAQLHRAAPTAQQSYLQTLLTVNVCRLLQEATDASKTKDDEPYHSFLSGRKTGLRKLHEYEPQQAKPPAQNMPKTHGLGDLLKATEGHPSQGLMTLMRCSGVPAPASTQLKDTGCRTPWADALQRLWDPTHGQPDGLRLLARVQTRLAGARPGDGFAPSWANALQRLWDPAQGQPAGLQLLARVQNRLEASPTTGRATTWADALQRLWDPTQGQPDGLRLLARVQARLAGARPGGGSCSTWSDALQSIWDPMQGQPEGLQLLARVQNRQAQARPDGCAMTWTDALQLLWDPTQGQPDGLRLLARVQARLGADPGDGRAATWADALQRLWDPTQGQPYGLRLLARVQTWLAGARPGDGTAQQPPASGGPRRRSIAAAAASTGLGGGPAPGRRGAPCGRWLLGLLEGTGHGVQGLRWLTAIQGVGPVAGAPLPEASQPQANLHKLFLAGTDVVHLRGLKLLRAAIALPGELATLLKVLRVGADLPYPLGLWLLQGCLGSSVAPQLIEKPIVRTTAQNATGLWRVALLLATSDSVPCAVGLTALQLAVGPAAHWPYLRQLCGLHDIVPEASGLAMLELAGGFLPTPIINSGTSSNSSKSDSGTALARLPYLAKLGTATPPDRPFRGLAILRRAAEPPSATDAIVAAPATLVPAGSLPSGMTARASHVDRLWAWRGDIAQNWQGLAMLKAAEHGVDPPATGVSPLDLLWALREDPAGCPALAALRVAATPGGAPPDYLAVLAQARPSAGRALPGLAC
eukprot:EG_transcript_2831